MRRSRRRGKRTGLLRKRAAMLFLAGMALVLIVAIFYRAYKPTLPTAKVLPKPKEIRFKVAIVLDDFGYNHKNIEAVLNLKRPVTFSILPFHPYSKIIARHVYQRGYEEILHLPLEPYGNDKVRPELNTITINMKSQEVLDRLTKALWDVPYAKGVSNHQGSRATEDMVLMQTIFKELKKKNLYFLDSLVTKKSVCKKTAKDAGVACIQRDVFLDNEEEFEYIKGQMRHLVIRAKRRGSAIGIGHDREKTILALSKLMPEAEKEGIEFVFLSELVK